MNKIDNKNKTKYLQMHKKKKSIQEIENQDLVHPEAAELIKKT
jgi:hypothetical protein